MGRYGRGARERVPPDTSVGAHVLPGVALGQRRRARLVHALEHVRVPVQGDVELAFNVPAQYIKKCH